MVSELTPILWDPLRFEISVVTPEITTVSEVVRVWDVEINPETAPSP